MSVYQNWTGISILGLKKPLNDIGLSIIMESWLKFCGFRLNFSCLGLEVSVYHLVPGWDISHLKEQGLMAIWPFHNFPRTHEHPTQNRGFGMLLYATRASEQLNCNWISCPPAAPPVLPGGNLYSQILSKLVKMDPFGDYKFYLAIFTIWWFFWLFWVKGKKLHFVTVTESQHLDFFEIFNRFSVQIA